MAVPESKKRSIRFPESDDNLCSFHAGAVLDQVDSRKDIWYQQTELSHIKRKAVVVSKEAHRYGFGSLLTNTYGNAGDETQDALNTWARNANSRRGLERWINNEYSAKRSDIRRRTIQSVLRAQEKMRVENIDDPDYGMKVLSRLSEAFSQDSRNFAACMGKADEEAAKDDWPIDAAQSVVKGHRIKSVRAPSPKTVVLSTRAPRKSLGLSGANDFRNFV